MPLLRRAVQPFAAFKIRKIAERIHYKVFLTSFISTNFLCLSVCLCVRLVNVADSYVGDGDIMQEGKSRVENAPNASHFRVGGTPSVFSL